MNCLSVGILFPKIVHQGKKKRGQRGSDYASVLSLCFGNPDWGFRPKKVDLRSVRDDLKPVRTDFRTVRADLRPMRADFSLVRAELGQRGLI